MRIKIFLFCITFFPISSCIYESPIFYYFTIINNSDEPLYIESQTINDSFIVYDTVFCKKEFKRDIMEIGCYRDYYGDTLIHSFFKVLKIATVNKKINIDPFNRVNWKEQLELKGGLCKGGDVYYKLEINDKEVVSLGTSI